MSIKAVGFSQRLMRRIIPVLGGLVLLGVWQYGAANTPSYILPSPGDILARFIENPALWARAWLTTVSVALLALLAAIILGSSAALLMSLSRTLEHLIYPYAVTLQVTPVVAIAPLILIYVDSPLVAQTLCAWIVAFFPILANTLVGLRSADRNLEDVFTLYHATLRQRMILLRGPASLPHAMTGVRIAGGLSLIGAVVAEMVAGGGGFGLAFLMVESSYRLDIPAMGVSLLLIAATGIAFHLILAVLSRRLLQGWHESAQDNVQDGVQDSEHNHATHHHSTAPRG
ncbi:MAG: ABC transporter permease subunit [Pseudomonadota bacterium]